MDSRGLRYFVLTWAVLWFTVIGPGHRRGLVRLPGPSQESKEASFYVMTKVSAGGCACARMAQQAEQSSQQESNRRSLPTRDCALCDINAKLNPPDAVVLWCLLNTVLTVLPPPSVAALIGVLEVQDPDARDPPVLA